MKKALLILAIVLVPLTASAIARRYFTEDQGTNQAAPTSSSTGLNLSRVRGYRVSVCADPNSDGGVNTLTGAGKLQVWLYNDSVQKWMRNNDLDLTVDAPGVVCQTFPDSEVAANIDGHRVYYQTSGVTVLQSDGGTIADGGATVRIDARLITE